MKLSTIETGFLKLDGGAMFGVIPKPLWSRMQPTDAKNRCSWSMRCLLIESGERKILVDTGIGNKQDEKFLSHFEPHGAEDLMSSLQQNLVEREDITDVFITHMHFDHVGGAVSKNKNGDLVPTFPNARYWSNELHYNWAFQPNVRERASFLKENFVPLQESGKLQFIDVQKEDLEWLPGIKVRFLYGHTEAMMLLKLELDGKTFVYCADLIPSSFHIGLPYIMSYDVRPLDTLAEKKRLLEEAVEHDYYLIFEHDPKTPCAKVVRNDRGRIVLGDTFAIDSLMV